MTHENTSVQAPCLVHVRDTTGLRCLRCGATWSITVPVPEPWVRPR
jgi:hypothetical protein